MSPAPPRRRPPLPGLPGLLGLLGPLALASCSSTTPPRTGYLSDYSRLEQVSDSTLRWFDEAALAGYDRLLIDAIPVRLHEDAQGAAVDDQRLRELASYMELALRDAVIDGYDVVEDAGPGVLRVRAALTDVDEGGASARLLGVGRVGGASLEAEFLDSLSGEQVGAVVTSAEASRFGFSGSTAFGDSRAVMDEWARRLRTLLDQAHGR